MHHYNRAVTSIQTTRILKFEYSNSKVKICELECCGCCSHAVVYVSVLNAFCFLVSF